MKVLKEKYLDPEEKFWDYGTGTINSINDIFSTNKTGMSYYDQLIPGSKDAEYMQKNKNLIGKIEYLSPKEYFERCSKDIFNNISVSDLINQRQIDTKTLNDIKTLITKYKKQLPLTFLNYAAKSQEGLHRMLVVAQLFGWDQKYPVLIVDYADKDLQDRLDKEKKEDEIRSKIYLAVEEALRYEFDSLDEFFDELQFKLDDKFYVSYNEPDIEFTSSINNGKITITVQDVDYTFDESKIKLNSELNEVYNPITVQKAKIFNDNQTIVGSPIKNYSGSIIKRANPVGKSIGGKIYAHMDYIHLIIPQFLLDKANELLKKNNLYDEAWSYNCFSFDPVNNIILFEETPDFDIAREPVIGKLIKVDLNTNTLKQIPPKRQIFHHKWLWVDNDYDGFDVEDSWNWSKEYVTKVLESPNGSNIEGWKNQLAKYGLE